LGCALLAAVVTAGISDEVVTRAGGVVATSSVSPDGAEGAGIALPGGVVVAAGSFEHAHSPRVANADRFGALPLPTVCGAVIDGC